MAYGHNNLSIKITPKRGRNRRRDRTLRAIETAKLDLGKKSSYLKGLSEAPVDIVRGVAEPNFEVKVSNAAEAWDVFKHIAGAPCTISLVWKKPGTSQRHVFRLFDAELENGGGFDSSADNGPSDTLKFKMLDVHLDGSSVYNQAA